MALLRVSRAHRVVAAVGIVLGLGFVAGLARSAVQVPGAGTYTLYSPEGRRSLTVRAVGSRDTLVVPLGQLAGLFGLKFQEDLDGRLVIETRGSRILAVPGQ